MSESATAEKLDESPEVEASDAQPENDNSNVLDELKVSPPGINRFGLQAEHNQTWRMNVSHKTVPEQCLEQDFWQHVAAHLRPGDEIIVQPDDMSWKLRLHVIDAGHNWAQVDKEHFVSFRTKDDMEPVQSVYAVRFAGTTHKYQVLRKGNMLKEGFATEALARQWAANHQAAVKR